VDPSEKELLDSTPLQLVSELNKDEFHRVVSQESCWTDDDCEGKRMMRRIVRMMLMKKGDDDCISIYFDDYNDVIEMIMMMIIIVMIVMKVQSTI